MQTGIIKWFNNAKGYGFIVSEGTEGDIFAHYSAIEMEGYKTLKAGETVEFEAEPGPKGLHAKVIRKPQAASEKIQQDETVVPINVEPAEQANG